MNVSERAWNGCERERSVHAAHGFFFRFGLFLSLFCLVFFSVVIKVKGV